MECEQSIQARYGQESVHYSQGKIGNQEWLKYDEEEVFVANCNKYPNNKNFTEADYKVIDNKKNNKQN